MAVPGVVLCVGAPWLVFLVTEDGGFYRRTNNINGDLEMTNGGGCDKLASTETSKSCEGLPISPYDSHYSYQN